MTVAVRLLYGRGWIKIRAKDAKKLLELISSSLSTLPRVAPSTENFAEYCSGCGLPRVSGPWHHRRPMRHNYLIPWQKHAETQNAVGSSCCAGASSLGTRVLRASYPPLDPGDLKAESPPTLYAVSSKSRNDAIRQSAPGATIPQTRRASLSFSPPGRARRGGQEESDSSPHTPIAVALG